MTRRYERLAGRDPSWFRPRFSGRSGRDPPLSALGCRRGDAPDRGAWHEARAARRVSTSPSGDVRQDRRRGASRWSLLGVMMDVGPEAFRRRSCRTSPDGLVLTRLAALASCQPPAIRSTPAAAPERAQRGIAPRTAVKARPEPGWIAACQPLVRRVMIAVRAAVGYPDRAVTGLRPAAAVWPGGFGFGTEVCYRAAPAR